MPTNHSEKVLNGATVWLLGHPVAHSVSPAMHNAAYRHMGLDHVFHKADVPPERLETALRGLVALGFAGANLTIPHKQAVLPLLSRLEPAAQAMQAVNCVKAYGDALVGTNTDAEGWLASWDEEIGQPLAGRRALLLGAGGAARGLAWALRSRGVEEIVVLNRSWREFPERVELLDERWPGWLAPHGLVVQCTPVGTRAPNSSPVTWPDTLPPGLVACDLIYNPEETAFLRDARERGAKTLGGLGMLVHQAAAAIRWWLHLEPPVEVMRAAARAALQ